MMPVKASMQLHEVLGIFEPPPLHPTTDSTWGCCPSHCPLVTQLAVLHTDAEFDLKMDTLLDLLIC